MKKMKLSKLLLIIPLLLLPGCSTKKEEEYNFTNSFYNRELKYFFGMKGTYFNFDLTDIFDDGIIVNYENKISKIINEYDNVEIYFDNTKDNFDYKFNIKKSFNIELIYPDRNGELYIRFINEEKKECSGYMLIAFVYVYDSNYINISTIEDLNKLNNYGDCCTAILRNDIDFADYTDINEWNPKSNCGLTLLNPYNYKIKCSKPITSSSKTNGAISLFYALENCYIDNLIFDEINYKNFDNPYLFPGLISVISKNCIIKNTIVKNFNYEGNSILIGGLVNASYNTSFINNNINMNIIQIGETTYFQNQIYSRIGGLSSTNFKYSDINYYTQNKSNPVTYNRFPSKYNVIKGTFDGVGAIGGLFGANMEFSVCNYDYNVIEVKLKSSINTIGEISGIEYYKPVL